MMVTMLAMTTVRNSEVFFDKTESALTDTILDGCSLVFQGMEGGTFTSEWHLKT
jgi:hypothetical protein